MAEKRETPRVCSGECRLAERSFIQAAGRSRACRAIAPSRLHKVRNQARVCSCERRFAEHTFMQAAGRSRAAARNSRNRSMLVGNFTKCGTRRCPRLFDGVAGTRRGMHSEEPLDEKQAFDHICRCAVGRHRDGHGSRRHGAQGPARRESGTARASPSQGRAGSAEGTAEPAGNDRSDTDRAQREE